MKLEKAYSYEIGKSITAQEADMHYENDNITSKFKFKCPDESCSAQVTCANLDRPKAQRKRDPYYKVVGDHGIDCEIAKDIDPQRKGTKGGKDIYDESDEYIDNAIRLNLQPPSTKKPTPTGNDPEGGSDEGGKKPSTNLGEGKRKIQRSKTLSSLVDAFLANESHMVQLPGVGVIDIKELFVEIRDQDISELPDEFRIYYGKGWIKKRKGGYGFVFAKNLKHGELECQPSTYISETRVDQSSFKRFKKTTLNKLANKYQKTIFLLSETSPYPNEDFINIWCEGLEYLEYRF